MKAYVAAISSVLGMACLGLILTGALTGQARGEEDRATWTVTGQVQVDQEDDDGNVLSVFIEDFDQGDFLVAGDGAGAELVDHVGETVEAIGWVTEDDDEGFYDYIIHVESYKILDEES